MVQSVRSASRERLVDELEAFAADRDSHGKHERARGAREAAQQLREGAESATFERVAYTVGEPARYTVCEGTRAELFSELDEAGKGHLHNGNEELAREAARAMGALQDGATSVRVGHLEYVVKDD